MSGSDYAAVVTRCYSHETYLQYEFNIGTFSGRSRGVSVFKSLMLGAQTLSKLIQYFPDVKLAM